MTYVLTSNWHQQKQQIAKKGVKKQLKSINKISKSWHENSIVNNMINSEQGGSDE